MLPMGVPYGIICHTEQHMSPVLMVMHQRTALDCGLAEVRSTQPSSQSVQSIPHTLKQCVRYYRNYPDFR